MKKAVVFDLDGTLADTAVGITHFLNVMLAHYGLSSISEARTKAYTGNGSFKLIERIFRDQKLPDDPAFLKQAHAYYLHAYQSDPLYKLAAFDGIEDMLRAVKRAGVKIAVLSNKPHAIAVPICKDLFGDLTDFVMGQMDGVPHKPDITAVRQICKTLDVDMKESAFVGDTKVDIQTGKAAGMTTIGVLWGFQSRAEMEPFGADAFISHPSEIPPLILK